MPEFDLTDPRGFIRDTIRLESCLSEKLQKIADLQEEIAAVTVESTHRKALLLSAFERLGEGKLYEVHTYHDGQSDWLVGVIDGTLQILPKRPAYEIPDALLTAIETPEPEDDLTSDDLADMALVRLESYHLPNGNMRVVMSQNGD